MPLINANALASIPTARWLLENSPRKLQIARLWPYLGVAGGEQDYARVAAFIGAGVAADCAPINESADTASQVKSQFAELMTRYIFCFTDQDRFRNPNDIDAVLYALALRRLLYTYFQLLDLAGPGVILSLRDKMDLANRAVDMGGGPLTLDCMDHAYHLVDENDGRPTVIMTSSRGLRTYHSLCRAAGFNYVPTVKFKWYNPATQEMDECEASAFNGTPILINDMMESFASAAPAVQRMYFMVMGDDGKSGPARGVTGIVPDDLLHTMFIKRSTNGVLDVEAGFTQPQPATDTWVSWPAGVAVPSQAAISMIHNFTPVADCKVGPIA